MKELETILALLDRGLTIEQLMTLAGQTVAQALPKEPPKEQPKEEPKEQPKEEPKEQPKEEPKEQPKEEPKKITMEDLYAELQKAQHNYAELAATIQSNAIQNSRMPDNPQKSVNDVIAEIIDPKGVMTNGQNA